MSKVVGGMKDVKDAGDDVQEICNQMKPKVEDAAGEVYSEFTAHKYSTQLVAGTNYFVKVHVGDGKYIHIRIYQNLQGERELTSHQKDKTQADELCYF